MTREILRPDGLFNSPHYSHAIKKSGTPLFISGQVAMNENGGPLHEGDAGAQARAAFASIERVVQAAGGSLGDIVKITIYTVDLAHRPAIGAARSEFFAPGEMPASTFIVVSSLADPHWLVEVEAVAMLD